MKKQTKKVIVILLSIIALLSLVLYSNGSLNQTVLVKNGCDLNKEQGTITCSISDRTLTSLFGKYIIALNLRNQPYDRAYFTSGMPVNSASIDGNYYPNDLLPAIINISSNTENGCFVSALGLCNSVIDNNGIYLMCDVSNIFSIKVNGSCSLSPTGFEVKSESNLGNFVIYTKEGGFNSFDNFCATNNQEFCNGEELMTCESHNKISKGNVEGKCGFIVEKPIVSETNYSSISIDNSPVTKTNYVPYVLIGLISIIVIIFGVIFYKRYR